VKAGFRHGRPDGAADSQGVRQKWVNNVKLGVDDEALAAFSVSLRARWTRILVSMKLPGTCLVPVEPEVGGQAAPEGPQALQQLLASGLARNPQMPGAFDVDLDLVALTQRQDLDDGGGETDRQAVTPFGNWD